jgi:Tol biopolymer transport system component
VDSDLFADVVTWSPDGQSVAYMAWTARGERYIQVVGVDVFESRRLASGAGWPSWASLRPAQGMSQGMPQGTAQVVMGNSSVTGQIQPGRTQTWTYNGQAGEVLTLTTQANWDTTLSLRLNGQQIAYNDDYSGLTSRIQHTLPTTGTYEIVVAGYSSSSGGAYTLRVEVFRVRATP